MTPGALRILKEMEAGADLISEGIHAYCASLHRGFVIRNGYAT